MWTVTVPCHTNPLVDHVCLTCFDVGIISVQVTVEDPKNETLTLGVDESYVLTVLANATATLHAPTVWGALRGLETFAQSVHRVAAGYEVPVATITDAPRLPFRGILVDSARHFLNVSTLQRIIDAMEMHKLNGA